MPQSLLRAALLSALPCLVATLAPAQEAAAPATAGTSAECDDASGRCSASVALSTEAGERFGTLGLQLGRDGSQPVLFAGTPLGIAVAPGVRVVADGSDLLLAVDACFPDGCRATLALSADQLAQVAGAGTLSLQFFAFGGDKALSADLDPKPLVAALHDAGVTLP